MASVYAGSFLTITAAKKRLCDRALLSSKTMATQHNKNWEWIQLFFWQTVSSINRKKTVTVTWTADHKSFKSASCLRGLSNHLAARWIR